MGAWGTGLYQDDFTCDIKEEYLNRLRVGYSNIDATNELIDYYFSKEKIDKDEISLFWFALADIQWNYGRLLPKVKKEALKHLKSSNDLNRWKDNKKQYEKRKSVLEELKKKLNSCVPDEKKVSKLTIVKSPWEVGDVLVYKIHNGDLQGNEDVKESKWYSKYVLLRVLAKVNHGIGSLPETFSNEVNVVGIYNWVGNEEPNPEKIRNLKLISLNGKYSLWTLSPHKKLLKQIGIKSVLKEISYTDNIDIINSDVGLIWLDKNCIDYEILNVLLKKEQDGNLLDETKL